MHLQRSLVVEEINLSFSSGHEPACRSSLSFGWTAIFLFLLSNNGQLNFVIKLSLNCLTRQQYLVEVTVPLIIAASRIKTDM